MITLMKLWECGGWRQVFDKLFKKDVVSWTVMIRGYAQHGHAKEAYTLFCQMQ